MEKRMNKKWKLLILTLMALCMFGMLSITSLAGFRQTEGGYRYYLDGTDQYLKGFQTVDNQTYYFNKKGYMQTGWVKIGKSYYHFADNGPMTRNSWYGPYFLGRNGKMVVNKWVGGRYVGKDGAWIQDYDKKSKPGFVKTAKGTKYKKPNGKYAKREWLWIGKNGSVTKGYWYYFYTNGIMAKDTWLNGIFHMNSKGHLDTDKWIGGRYVDKDGELVRNAWVKNTYYVGYDGRKYRNMWIDDHYVGSNGKMVKKKWIGNKYLQKDGTLAKDKWINGKYVDKNGNWVKNKKQ